MRGGNPIITIPILPIVTSGSQILAVFGQGISCMVLEKFTQRRLVGEIQFIGYLLHGIVGVFQHSYNLPDKGVADPVIGSFTCLPFHDAVQILMAYTQFRGIETDRMMLQAVAVK